jgi:hypothetical protein
MVGSDPPRQNRFYSLSSAASFFELRTTHPVIVAF